MGEVAGERERRRELRVAAVGQREAQLSSLRARAVTPSTGCRRRRPRPSGRARRARRWRRRTAARRPRGGRRGGDGGGDALGGGEGALPAHRRLDSLLRLSEVGPTGERSRIFHSRGVQLRFSPGRSGRGFRPPRFGRARATPCAHRSPHRAQRSSLNRLKLAHAETRRDSPPGTATATSTSSSRRRQPQCPGLRPRPRWATCATTWRVSSRRRRNLVRRRLRQRRRQPQPTSRPSPRGAPRGRRKKRFTKWLAEQDRQRRDRGARAPNGRLGLSAGAGAQPGPGRGPEARRGAEARRWPRAVAVRTALPAAPRSAG